MWFFKYIYGSKYDIRLKQLKCNEHMWRVLIGVTFPLSFIETVVIYCCCRLNPTKS
jgi:hypothetical protein